MANEALAPAAASQPGAPNEEEYQTFCAALSASGRGRAFLAEYARRNRGADTEVLLAALARLESVMRLQRAGAEPVRGELRALLASIRKARPEIEASALPVRAAKLALLLDILERRLEALAESAPALPGDSRLTVVPPPDEPELPIPSPSAAQPALTLAHDRGPPPAKQAAPEVTAMLIIPEVTWLDGPPPGTEDLIDAAQPDSAAPVSMAEKVAVLTAQPAKTPPAPSTPPEAPKVFEPLFAEPPPPKSEPLAALMLLSEDERLALFT